MHCYFNHSLSSELQGIDISMVSYDGIMYASAVYNHWTGLVDWTGGLAWTGGLDWWTVTFMLSKQTHCLQCPA